MKKFCKPCNAGHKHCPGCGKATFPSTAALRRHLVNANAHWGGTTATTTYTDCSGTPGALHYTSKI
jgi:hypothetical protein